MTSGITDSRWPPRRPVADPVPASPLDQYPSFLAPRQPQARRTFPLLPAAVIAYAVSFVAQVVAAIPLGFLVIARGVSVFSGPHTDEDVDHAALLVGIVFVGTLVVVGVASCWGALRILGVRGAFLASVAGIAADFAGGALGRLVSDPLGLVLGAVAGVAVIYVVALRRLTDH